MNCTFPGPYVAVASQCVSGKNDKGGGGATSIYFIKADGSVDDESLTMLVRPTRDVGSGSW